MRKDPPIREALGPDADRLDQIFTDDTAFLCGATPTDQPNNVKAKALRTRGSGDRVLFYAGRKIIAQATVLECFDNAALARAVWGKNDDGDTWQHIMALGDVDEFDPGLDAEPILRPLIHRSDLRGIQRCDASEFARVAHLLVHPAQPAVPPLIPAQTTGPQDDEVTATTRRSYSGERVDRNGRVPARVKRIYGDKCQVCRRSMRALNGELRSVGAHIRGFGAPHDGPDHISNILCLCANYHAEFDWGTFHIDHDADGRLAVFDTATLARTGDLVLDSNHHPVNTAYTDYHRDWCLAELAKTKGKKPKKKA